MGCGASADTARIQVAWQCVSSNAPWKARVLHGVVTLPDGGLLLSGGTDNFPMSSLACCWRSNDKGVTWNELGERKFGHRTGHAVTVLKDGTILVIAGDAVGSGVKPPRLQDVWCSLPADRGESMDNWVRTEVKGMESGALISDPWGRRQGHEVVVLQDGGILLLAGLAFPSGRHRDVWRSDDNGTLWTKLPEPPWQERWAFGSGVLPNGDVLVFGGESGPNKFNNDVWRSPDGGKSWQELPPARWSKRIMFGVTGLPSGAIAISGGLTESGVASDGWITSDGTSWHSFQLPGAWQRWGHKMAALPGGQVLLLGGSSEMLKPGTPPTGYKSDVWACTEIKLPDT